MKEKVLVLASVASMIDQFNMPNIELLLSMGYEVHVACNFERGSTCSEEKILMLKNKLTEMNVKFYQIDFTRSVFNLIQDYKSYKQVKKIMTENHYKFIHCHSPIGGVVGRVACKVTKTKCIYTAHGFHFYKGAPISNWILFYPIEWICSLMTDILITINKEDYSLAKKRMHAKQVEYIPGVGIDIAKFRDCVVDRDKKREELGIPKDAFMVLSVGELSKRKNHEVVIRALNKIYNQKIYYCVAGQGELNDYLLKLAKALGINFKLLGFRQDVPELLKSSDLFAFPSKREGLGLGAVEAMAAGLPVITSDVNGINDYSLNDITGFKYSPDDIEGFSNGIEILRNDLNKYKKIKANNQILANQYDLRNVLDITEKIYKCI